MTRIDKDKVWRCKDCGVLISEPEILEAPNPFDADDIIYGCQYCKAIGAFALICDEPNCVREVTAGFPVKEGFGGYRQTCSRHYQEYGGSS